MEEEERAMRVKRGFRRGGRGENDGGEGRRMTTSGFEYVFFVPAINNVHMYIYRCMQSSKLSPQKVPLLAHLIRI